MGVKTIGQNVQEIEKRGGNNMVKGMLKRALSLFLTLFLVIGFLPAATVSAATETVGGMLADPFIGLSSTGDSSGSWTAVGRR